MSTIRKDLLRRVERMEQSFPPLPRWPNALVTMSCIERQRSNLLAPDERIVLDWYQCLFPEVGFFWARERIATDPADHGRVCKPGQCLEDVKRELGQDCHRGADGSCEDCPAGQYPDWVQWPQGLELG